MTSGRDSKPVYHTPFVHWMDASEVMFFGGSYL